MTVPTTKTEFKEFCLRQLGKPVINIEVDDTQVDDCIDLALSYFADYHFDGTEKTYLKHQITSTDITNKYITIAENIIGVVRIFPISGATSTSNIFDIRNQIVLNEILNMADYSLAPYVMTMTNIAMIEQVLIGQTPIRYQRHTNKLYIDTDWSRLSEGQFIVAEAYGLIDPEVYTDVWKDRWLTNYTVALIKRQWGNNLKKYSGMEMPGGTKFNGQIIYDEAEQTIESLEAKMHTSFSLPLLDAIA
jgi:hypothetical protein